MKIILSTIAYCCILISFSSLQAQVTIDADHPDINYWGRVDFTNSKAPAFEFSGVTIRAKFTGTSIKAKFQDYGAHGATTTNYFYRIIDGGTPQKFEVLAGSNTYSIATGLSAGSHTVELIKLTEAAVGKSAFQGFVLDGGATLLPLSEPSCEIEFIGNSITCGYGNEVNILASGNPTTGFHSANENNYNAWGYITARNLGMKYRAVCYSGRGIYRNNNASTTGTLPGIYDRIFPDNASSPVWNHASHHPNYIVINLGTNDFFPDPANPVNQETFESTYVNFVKRLKGYHPDAVIILSAGVMMSDGYPVGAQQWTRIRTYVKNVVNTLKSSQYQHVYYYEMSPQNEPYGEDWHPSTATHISMASGLTAFINSLNIQCASSEADLNYSISNWLDNKKAAISLTFDDWSPGHPAIVIPELKKRSVNATFFITNALGTPDWSQIRNAHADGNEIANHTKSHPDLTTLSGDQKKAEIRDARSYFAEKLTGGKVLTFAYPFGTYDQAVIDSVKNSNHIASRGVQSSSGNYTYNFAPSEDDYYKILTYGMDNKVSIAQFNSQIESIIKGGGLLTYLYHSIYSNTINDNSYAQIHQNDLAKQLDTLLSRKNDVWICTFAQAIQYHREKKTATLTETSAPFKNGNTWKLNLSDKLPDSLYFQPLTIKVKKPSVVANVLSIYQNGKKLNFKILSGEFVFNAVPDGGEITINISACAVPEINLHPAEEVVFCSPEKALLFADHVEGNTYEWFKDGVAVENSSNDSIAVSEPGVYSVNVTNNGCSIASDVLGKTIVVAKSDDCKDSLASQILSGYKAASVKLFPNPAGNLLMIDINAEDPEWLITNMTGHTLTSGKGKTVDVSELPSGIYFLRILNQVMKFVKR
ncbi:MAG: polysaccharide deacetylase family protein [Sporocytophaga sp.]|nr:polysaccharide deacetylase family protein [Sporocytophaga sp.]